MYIYTYISVNKEASKLEVSSLVYFIPQGLFC